MSITISANSNMVGGLFNSMNKNLFNSSSGNMFSGMGMMGGINFSDYASIRNGSYHKLLSSYYSLGDMDSDFKVDSGSKTDAAGSTSRTYHYWTKDGIVERTYNNGKTSSKAPTSTSTSKEKTSQLATIESDAEKLGDAADALLTSGTKSLFKQVTTTDKDGNKTTGYNKDAIYNAVKDYVSGYNALIKSAGESNIVAIRSSASSIMDYTKKNQDLLSSIGISVDPDKKTLTVDKEAFQNADMDTVKKLFQGTNSYGYQVSAKASAIDYHAQYEAKKANTYNVFGNYSNNFTSGSMWNSVI